MKLTTILILFLLVLLSGCAFVRIDIEPDRTSATLITVLKDFNIDPNHYESKSKNIRTLTGLGSIKTVD